MGFFWDIGGFRSVCRIIAAEVLIFREKEPGPIQERAVCGREETVEADLVEPPWKNVLEVATDKLFGGKRCALPVLVAESHSMVLNGQDTAVADRYPADVATEVLENGFAALNGWLGVDHPLFLPDGLGKLDFGKPFARQGDELGAKNRRERPHGDKISIMGRKPGGPVGCEPTSGNQTVDVGMGDECPGPGVKHGENGDCVFDKTGIFRERDKRCGRGLHQRRKQNLLVGSDDLAELGRKREDHVAVGHGQKLCTPLIEPCFSLYSMAPRTAPISARMIGVMELATVVAFENVPAAGRGPALQDVPKGLPVARKHPVPVKLQVLRSVLAEDLGERAHEEPS